MNWVKFFSRRLHHQRRAIKSMIVCEQLAISTATRVENYGEEHFRFAFKVSLRFFPFQGFKGQAKKCENCLWIEPHSHLMHRFVVQLRITWSLWETRLIPLVRERSVARDLLRVVDELCDEKRRYIYKLTFKKRVHFINARESRRESREHERSLMFIDFGLKHEERRRKVNRECDATKRIVGVDSFEWHSR